MKPDKLRALILRPESDELEFKVCLPRPPELARLVSAFANTKGGTLVVSVEEGGKVVGVDDPERAWRVLARAAHTISR